MSSRTARPAASLAALAAILVLALPQTGLAGTVTGRAKANATKVYAFISDDDGQVLMTLTWPKASAELFMLVVDDSDDPFTWCIGASGQNRTQRCEFGAFGSTLYGIGISSFRGASKFQLNVQSSGSEFVTRGTPGRGQLRELEPSHPLFQRVVERMRRMGGTRR